MVGESTSSSKLRKKKNGFLFTFFRQKKDEITPIYIIIYNVMGPLLWTLALSD
jgi:hypothetical protein